MTKKLEELFNLPPIDDVTDTDNDVPAPPVPVADLESVQSALAEADKIDRALAPVKGLEELDRDMDNYADRAMTAFENLMDLGQNVEDRHAATVFEAAAKMMSNAITAKQSKMDKKLKVIQMQMQKKKLDLEERKLEWQMTKDLEADEDTAIEGTGEVIMDRNEIINAIVKQVRQGNT